MKKILLITILLILSIPSISIKAESGLQITPAVLDIVVTPGESTTGSFKLINNNEFSTILEISKGLRNDDNTVSIENFTNSSIEWINLGLDRITIESQKENTFNYTITIPASIDEGMYRPMFIFKLLSSNEDTGSITSLSQLLPFQFNIIVSKSGEYNGELSVSNLSTSKNILLDNNQNINFKLENLNVSPTKPIIRLQVVSPTNDVVYQSVQNENLSYLIKGKEISNILDISNIFNNEMSFGKYSVELFAKDTLTDKVVTQKTSFWFVPQQVLIILVLVLIVISAIGFAIYKFKNRKVSKKKQDKHLFMYK